MECYVEKLREFIGLSGGQAHHLFLEFSLIVWVLWLICKKSTTNELKLTENEKEALIRDYEPEPLVTEVSPSHFALKPRVVRGKAGKYINIDGIECLNFATHNYLGFIGDDSVEKDAMKTIEKYGVGSCGPRGFYGTTEVHLALEKQLAEFMGAEDAVVYSYAFSTISSAIPAYAKKGDMIFVDERANFAIQKGLDASRSVIKVFKHNDIKDLERLLEETKKADLKNPKKAQRSRRFLVVEGICANTGEICPLPQLVELRRKYKLRLFLDESISFGVLGKTGRGVTEHFGIPRTEVDLVMASLENSLASIGGFCVGTFFIVDHQRLSGLGYCFSASLPPLHVIAAMEGLRRLDQQPDILEKLNRLCGVMHDALNSSSIINNHFTVCGDCDSPVHLLLLKPDVCCSNPQSVIGDIIELCLQERIAVSRASFLANDSSKTPACIRVTTSLFLSDDDIAVFIRTLESACRQKFLETYSAS
ncbi:serine palmitoyltransferase 1-like [Macrosteles quadrilineatus]|uniref:serine palmitoyltransferase 1-like n=1 Tax=Macrosteles quadrilineatus TaxID=74068 RepID=UPI0023E16B52|nr:serine palmitoyltransferase 1-like [Macrosteles quadrilineatus]